MRSPKRRIKAAIVEDYGIITADELLAMSEMRWGTLRDKITDRRRGNDGYVANCAICGGEVFIKISNWDGQNLPLFSHYKGSDPSCPWHHEHNANLDDPRANQYQGRQVSVLHSRMCNIIAELVKLDKRHVNCQIEGYLPPTKSQHGRFPDVYVEWENFPPFVVEFQMSNTFQTEISDRCKFYEREGKPILWILLGLSETENPPQNFLDVIRRHRENGFVLDREAIEESRKQKTLVLKCFLRNRKGFDSPILVRFDDLKISKTMLFYYEDRLSELFLQDAHEKRLPWFSVLRKWNHYDSFPDLNIQQSLLLATAFSIAATANGKEINYASRNPNIKGMLNAYLNSGKFSNYVNLLEEFIKNTALKENYLPATFWDHMNRRRGENQVDENSKEWKMLRELFPEVLNPIERAELMNYGMLPKWAGGARTIGELS